MLIPGVDVHSGYGAIDWGLVAQSGIRFAYVKCTQGNEAAKDPTYERNIQRARENGIAVGAYHFAYPLPYGSDKPRGRSPLEQAQAAFEACSALGGAAGELSPAVDAEWPPLTEWVKWGCSAQQISEWLHAYCESVTLLWGRKPVIYSYPDWWRGNQRTYHGLSDANVSWASAYMLWMAAYTHPQPGVPDSGGPPVPFPWSEWAIWQYSAEGSSVRIHGIPACPIDRDCIKDEETFERLLGRDHETNPEIRLDLLESEPPPPIDGGIVYALPDPPLPKLHDDDEDNETQEP